MWVKIIDLNGLEIEEIKTKVNRDFRYNPSSAAKDAYSQSQNLITALASATTAEKELLNLSSAIKQHIQGNQGMYASVNLSVAEQTIRDYTYCCVSGGH